MLVSVAQVCIVYIVKEVNKLCHSGGPSQLMGVARKRTCVLAADQ